MLDKERKAGVLEKYAAQEFVKMAYLQALEDADVYAFEDRKEAILELYLLSKEAGAVDTTLKWGAKVRSWLTGAKPGHNWYWGSPGYEGRKALRLKNPETGTATASRTTGDPAVDSSIAQLGRRIKPAGLEVQTKANAKTLQGRG